MKKVKLLSLILLVVMVFATFTACQSTSKISKVASFNDLYKSSYVPKDETYTTVEALSAFDNYLITSASEEFIVFASTNATNGEIVNKVYSYASNSVILTVTTSAAVVYSINLCGDLPAFFVTKETIGESASLSFTLYDNTATEITSSTKNVGSPVVVSDMLVYDSVIYTLGKDGKLVANEKTIPEYISIIDFNASNDKYFYSFDDENNSFNVYDLKFNPVSSYIAPSYAEMYSQFLLDNGNVLIQYCIELDDHAKDYDFIEYAETSATKYDLVSFVFDVKNSSEKHVELAYIVDSLTAYSEIEALGLDDVYSSKMKNLAYINPIVNGQVDYSDAAYDVVLLSNDCKTAKSLKIVDQQTFSFPTKLSKKYFVVETLYGSAIVTANGKTVYPITNDSMSANSKYFVGEKAVYDLKSFKVIYDLEENDATVICMMESELFIRVGTEAKHTVLLLKDDETKEICSYDEAAGTGKLFTEALTEIGCYALYDVKAAKYTYYNLEGTELTSSTYKLTAVAGSDKYDVVIAADLESGLGYNLFKKTVEK